MNNELSPTQKLSSQQSALLRKIEDFGDNMLLSLGEDETLARQLEKKGFVKVEQRRDDRLYASSTGLFDRS